MKQYFAGQNPNEIFPDHIGVKALGLLQESYKVMKKRSDLETVIGNYLPRAKVNSVPNDKSTGAFIVK